MDDLQALVDAVDFVPLLQAFAALAGFYAPFSLSANDVALNCIFEIIELDHTLYNRKIADI